MDTKMGCHTVNNRNVFYELGEVLGDVAKIQKAFRLAQCAAQAAKVRGDWDGFAQNNFDSGRLVQGLHNIREKYNLNILVQDIFSLDEKETREGFEAVRKTYG